MRKSLLFSSLLMVFLCSSFVFADYSIDISGLSGDEYSLGEEILFQVVLLDENSGFVSEEVEVVASDALGKKEVIKTVTSNADASLSISSDYPSGLWTMSASFGDAFVERSFVVGANLEVEFEIIDDELYIRNIGNIRYTKTVEITIGEVKNSYAQNIGIGEEKVLKLISNEGNYDITVTDGTTTITKRNVYLAGGTTGNVVGAVNKELVGYSGFAGVADAGDDNGQFISLSKLPLALTFVAGVFILGALVFVERRLTSKHKKKK